MAAKWVLFNVILPSKMTLPQTLISVVWPKRFLRTDGIFFSCLLEHLDKLYKNVTVTG